MILLQNYTPEIYYKQSRDFQFLGRLYDIVLNSVKTNADMIYDIPASDAIGSKMVDLLALTLGFKAIHSYNIKQLTAICSILPTILRLKGSEQAIEIVCQTVLTAEGVTSNFIVVMDQDTHTLQLYIPQALSDINLLKDLLAYILPAGVTVELARTTSDIFTPNTRIGYKDDVLAYSEKGNFTGNVIIYTDPNDATAKTSHIPSLVDLKTNAERLIDNHTNDKNYRGIISNTLTESYPPVNNDAASDNND